MTSLLQSDRRLVGIRSPLSQNEACNCQIEESRLSGEIEEELLPLIDDILGFVGIEFERGVNDAIREFFAWMLSTGKKVDEKSVKAIIVKEGRVKEIKWKVIDDVTEFAGKECYKGLYKLKTVSAIEGGEKALIEMDIKGEFGLKDKNVIDYFKERTFNLALRTRLALQGDLRYELSEGLWQGEGVYKLRERIRGITDRRFSGYEVERLARTESANAQLKGRLLGYKERTRYVSWVKDAVACEKCLDREGVVVTVEEAMHMADPVHPNCQCPGWVAKVDYNDFTEEEIEEHNEAVERYKKIEGQEERVRDAFGARVKGAEEHIRDRHWDEFGYNRKEDFTMNEMNKIVREIQRNYEDIFFQKGGKIIIRGQKNILFAKGREVTSCFPLHKGEFSSWLKRKLRKGKWIQITESGRVR